MYVMLTGPLDFCALIFVCLFVCFGQIFAEVTIASCLHCNDDNFSILTGLPLPPRVLGPTKLLTEFVLGVLTPSCMVWSTLIKLGIRSDPHSPG